MATSADDPLLENFHSLPLEDLLSTLDVNQDTGLSENEAMIRLERYGDNALTPPAVVPEWKKFLKHFLEFFSLLLEAGALLCFIAFAIDSDTKENLYLGIVLAVVVFVTCVFTYLQEGKASNLLKNFGELLPDMSVALRSGQRSMVPSTSLVPGDVLVLQSGDKVPADARVLSCRSLKVDNSSLTGESDPQARTTAPTHEQILETGNVVFSGTMVVDGSGTAVIVATGDLSMIGRIASLMSSTKVAQTPIHREIAHFIKIITIIAMVLGVVFGVASLMMSRGPLSSLVFVIGIIVANVPEGLLATVTVSLTLTAARMSKKMVLVKALESVETLGSTTVIASDKTGTLTQNRMTVVNAWFDGHLHGCSTTGDVSQPFDTSAPTFVALRDCAAICGRATFRPDPANEALPPIRRETIGDASESAILKFCEPLIPAGGVAAMRGRNPLAFEIPFNSSNKWHLVIVRPDGTDKDVLYIKGAPERIISKCSHALVNGEKVPVDDAFRAKFQEAYLNIAKMGQRVLGFASLPVDGPGRAGGKGEGGRRGGAKGGDAEIEAERRGFGTTNNLGSDGESDHGNNNNGNNGSNSNSDSDGDDDSYGYGSGADGNGSAAEYDEDNVPMDGYVFAGLLAMVDPPRADVPRAVELCQTAGVRVMMVTGDHPVTALAIARDVGIVRGRTVDDIAAERGVDPEDVPLSEADAVVTHGSRLRDLDDQQWDDILSKDQIVFARMSPEQKLIIVDRCQGRGEIVAVTGDGVNDSPALKKADIGIAMGITGSDVSKEAADMILLDDNFASIVAGIEEGRLIFDNLKKSIAYTLSSNIPEIAPFIIHVLFDLPLPLSTSLILAIDLLADLGPAISLAYERPESDIMHRPPRDASTERLVTAPLISFSYLQVGMAQAFGGLFAYFVVLCDYGFVPKSVFGVGRAWENGLDADPGDEGYLPEIDPVARELCRYGTSTACGSRREALLHAQTASFIAIIIMQIADLLVCKTRRFSIFTHGIRNRALLLGIASEVFVGILICYVPFMNTAMGTRPIRFEHWVLGLPYALVILVYEEVRKLIVRQHDRACENLARYRTMDSGDADFTDVIRCSSKPLIHKEFRRWVATYTPW